MSNKKLTKREKRIFFKIIHYLHIQNNEYIMKHSLYITTIMLLALTLSQGYWLYNIYNAEKYKTQEILEELFEEAIKQEMSKRMVRNKPKDLSNP